MFTKGDSFSSTDNNNLDLNGLQDSLRTLSIGKMPPLRMRSVSPSPTGQHQHSPHRRRANTFTAGQPSLSNIIRERRMASWFSPPCSPQSIPRDPIQPSAGSISDLSDRHSSAGEGDDEDEGDDDHFSLTHDSRQFRPRSRTCPENRAWRKKKLKVMKRPPTPPPSSSPTPGLMTSSLDVPISPCLSPMNGSYERLNRRLSHELPSCAEEEQSSWFLI